MKKRNQGKIAESYIICKVGKGREGDSEKNRGRRSQSKRIRKQEVEKISKKDAKSKKKRKQMKEKINRKDREIIMKKKKHIQKIMIMRMKMNIKERWD